MNFEVFKDKLLLHQDPGKDPMTPHFETALPTKIVEVLNRFPRGTLIECTKTLPKKKDQLAILCSVLYTKLAEHASQNFDSVLSIESYMGTMRMHNV